jgi:hypothetical protein
VHRLSNFGAVLTHTAHGTSHEGFDAEWRMIQLSTVEGDRINRCELFDETDLDAALGRFEELQPQARRLENAASQVVQRFWTYFEARDWDAMAETITDDFCTHDRRRVVNAGVLRGRAVHITNMRAVAQVGFERITSTVIAIRGQRLALIRIRSSMRGSPPGEVSADMPSIVEIDADGRLAAAVHFDSDDIDAAFEELDARYLAGEAAAHAHTWSVIVRIYAAFNRHELYPTTADWVNADHRRGIAFAPGDMTAYLRAGKDLTPDTPAYIETVHRLSDFGAVVTQAMKGTSSDGFDAEWQEIGLFTFDGDLISRCELFDEGDLDAAVARFEEMQPQAPRLENTASQIIERYQACFAVRDWAAMAELLADDIVADDRRRVVNAGIRRGRDVHIADMRAAVQVGAETISASVIATRSERLAVAHVRSFNLGFPPAEVGAETLGIAEIDADERIVAMVTFDPDDVDAALAELDARYLAGEAAAHSHTWSVIARAYAAFKGHELPATPPDSVYIDHRPLVTVEAVDLDEFTRATWDITPDVSFYIEAVHQLSERGAVVSLALKGTSQEGFSAEWRLIEMFTVEGDLVSRCEIFDEAGLDAALARFDELSPAAPLLENAATRTWGRVSDAFNRRDRDGFLALGSAGVRFEDRRKGLRDVLHGPVRRKAVQAIFEIAPSGWQMTVEPIAIRGPRLSLTRACYRDTDDADRPIAAELLHVTEVGDNELLHTTVSFDPDDLNDAFAELTARWIASGEVAHPEIIISAQELTETVNRHDWDALAALSAGAVYVNHRQLSKPGVETITDHMSSFRTMASLVPDFWVEQADVLAQSAMGVVNHVVLRGTSTDGVAIEVPLVALMLFDGDRVTRVETFDVDQRDRALARFEELSIKSQPK